jgi:CRISPR-associated protein Cmr3
MQSEALTEHNQAMEDWEQACNLAEKNKEPKPPQPKLHNYFTTDATTEAIAKIQNDQPTKGFVGYFDELEGLFKGANQYRSGRGNDTEKMLSGRDGTGFKVDRSNGKQLFVEKSGYSITGGIQPDVLRKRYGDLSDSNGQWARFIWDDLSKTEPAPYPESDICYNSNELLREIYQKLERQSAITHILLPDAKQQYSQWYSATR